MILPPEIIHTRFAGAGFPTSFRRCFLSESPMNAIPVVILPEFPRFFLQVKPALYGPGAGDLCIGQCQPGADLD